MDLGLKDKRVVVTGSSRGIGYAIAEAFLEEGARVMLNGVDAKRLADAEQALQTPDGRVSSVATDIASVEGGENFSARLTGQWGGLDVCINNAAIHEASDFTKLEEDLWDRTVNMNLKKRLSGRAGVRAHEQAGDRRRHPQRLVLRGGHRPIPSASTARPRPRSSA